jgi:hypothetical protein
MLIGALSALFPQSTHCSVSASSPCIEHPPPSGDDGLSSKNVEMQVPRRVGEGKGLAHFWAEFASQPDVDNVQR